MSPAEIFDASAQLIGSLVIASVAISVVGCLYALIVVLSNSDFSED